MTQIYLTKSLFEKNSTDGISYFTDLNEMAEHIHADESCGGSVQVYKCVPVDHEVYTERLSLTLSEPTP